MKKLTFIISAAIILLSNIASAQTSKEILDKLSKKAKGWKSISADFTSTLKDQKANVNQKQEGNIKIKGNKYHLNLSQYTVISDGTTVWSYDKKSNSCTIDNLEDIKDGAFDPSEMFTIWEKDFKHEMKNTNATVDGEACYEIHLYPNQPKNKPYHTIVMYITKSKMEANKIVVKTRENAEISYKVKNFKTNSEFPDTDFKFNKASYPGVDVVDNRI
jgi:outer membrane lipoprotein-sorting protein